MSKIEYLLTFISIIIALGVSELLFSLHKLLKIRNGVKWHWIPLAWSLSLFLAHPNIYLRDSDIDQEYLGAQYFYSNLSGFIYFHGHWSKDDPGLKISGAV